MLNRNTRPKRQLLIKTTQIGDRIYCGSDRNPLEHKFAKDRHFAGHYPGIVYIARIPPFAGYKECHKIGKVEHTKILHDNFKIHEIQEEMLKSLYTRWVKYHCSSSPDPNYYGAKFIFGIFVACGEGAEKQVQSFFEGQRANSGLEMFNLTEDNIEEFRAARGSVLGQQIEPLTSEDFAKFLVTKKHFPKEWVLKRIDLPETWDYR